MLACHAGDVVLARSMQNPKQIVCKRVLGLEGDEVRIPQSTQMGPGRTVVVCSTVRTAGQFTAHGLDRGVLLSCLQRYTCYAGAQRPCLAARGQLHQLHRF